LPPWLIDVFTIHTGSVAFAEENQSLEPGEVPLSSQFTWPLRIVDLPPLSTFAMLLTLQEFGKIADVAFAEDLGRPC